MTSDLSPQKIQEIAEFSDDKRAKYCFTEIAKQQEVWVLTDEHGCVMLNTEDEDCVPVWPNEVFALSWANQEWSECKAEAIPLNKWYSRWTQGLIDDDLSLVVFPSSQEQGVVLFADEFEHEVRKAK